MLDTNTEAAVKRNTQIKVMVVEDYKLVRVGILSVLRKDEDLKVVGECESAEDALSLIKRERPDVVLMDLGLPGMNGIEATRKIKEFDSSIKVIILTSHDNEEEVIASLGSGANAYCLKDIPSSIFMNVIKSVHEGAAWLDPHIAQVALKLFSEEQKAAATLFTPTNSGAGSNLTPREMKVLSLLVQGKSNSEIAHEIDVSVHTVKVHVSNILEKLAVYDRVQAAVKAVKEGIVQ